MEGRNDARMAVNVTRKASQKGGNGRRRVARAGVVVVAVAELGMAVRRRAAAEAGRARGRAHTLNNLRVFSI